VQLSAAADEVFGIVIWRAVIWNVLGRNTFWEELPKRSSNQIAIFDPGLGGKNNSCPRISGHSR